MTPHALIVHGDRSTAEVGREILDSSGFMCRVATGFEEAVTMLDSHCPHVLLVDRSAASTPAQNPHPPVAPGMIGESAALRDALVLARKAARSEANISLCGESGTGKELAAKAIHDASNRAGRAFVAVDCASLPENLLEAELFGHEKGAFTGAIRSNPGLMESADRGTIIRRENRIDAAFRTLYLQLVDHLFRDVTGEGHGTTRSAPTTLRLEPARLRGEANWKRHAHRS